MPILAAMKAHSRHFVMAAKRSAKLLANKAAKRARHDRGEDAVALFMWQELTRKPRVNPWLLKAFQANRDLFEM